MRLAEQLDLVGCLRADIPNLGELCAALLDNAKENLNLKDVLGDELDIIMEVSEQ